MAEGTEENPLEDIKEKIHEVIELLNQPNLPVVVREGAEPIEPVDPKE